jgi:hypothetical protein
VLRSNKSADAAWFAEKVLAHFPGQFPETPCICACVAATDRLSCCHGVMIRTYIHSTIHARCLCTC